MKLKMIAGAALAAVSLSSFAAIAPGGNANPELFLTVRDAAAQVSYTLDLGVSIDAFLTAGQSANGLDRSWALTGDARFASFLGLVNSANLEWAVMGIDTTGPTTTASQRLFATAAAGTTAATIQSTNSSQLRSGLSSANNFINAVNTTGTHLPANDFTVNGSSVNAIADAGVSYFGEAGGTGPRLQANTIPFSVTNAVNTASSFYVVASTSSASPVGLAGYDLFDNAGGAGSFVLSSSPSGYTLSYHIAAVPEPTGLALLLAGLGAVGFVGRRRRND